MISPPMTSRRLLVAKFLLAGGLLTGAALWTMLPASGASEKVTICHASGKDGTTKYVTLNISENAVYKENGGHFYENGTPRAGHEDDYFGACKTDVTTTTVANDDDDGETTTTTEGDGSTTTTTEGGGSTTTTTTAEDDGAGSTTTTVDDGGAVIIPPVEEQHPPTQVAPAVAPAAPVPAPVPFTG